MAIVIAIVVVESPERIVFQILPAPSDTARKYTFQNRSLLQQTRAGRLGVPHPSITD